MPVSVSPSRIVGLAVLAFVLLLFVAPPVTVFVTRFYGVALPVAALLCLWPVLQQGGLPWRSRHFWLVLLAVLGVLLYGVIASPVAGKAEVSARSALVVALSGLVLQAALPLLHTYRQKLFAALACGLALTVALLVFEYATAAQLNNLLASWQGQDKRELYELDRAVVGLAMLVWPALAWFRHRGAPAFILLLLPLLAAAVFMTSSQSALVGLGAGMGVVLAVWLLPRLSLPVLQYAVPLLLLGWPFIMIGLREVFEYFGLFWQATSSDIRLNIWYQVAVSSLQSPLWGHGIEAARLLPVCIDRGHGHPHNGPLQIWYEFGALGMMVAAYGFNRLVTHIASWPREVAVLGQGALVCWLAIFSVSYNIWQLWWMALAVLAWLLFRLTVQRPPAN